MKPYGWLVCLMVGSMVGQSDGLSALVGNKTGRLIEVLPNDFHAISYPFFLR